MPDGVSNALLNKFKIIDRSDEVAEIVKKEILNAAGSIFTHSHESPAFECLAAALSDPSSPLREAALLTMARYPQPDFLPLLTPLRTTSLREYDRVLLGYALRKADPLNQEPNLLSDIDAMRQRLSDNTITSDARATLVQGLGKAEATVEALRVSR